MRSPGANFLIPSQASSLDRLGRHRRLQPHRLGGMVDPRAMAVEIGRDALERARAVEHARSEPEGVVARPEDRRIALDPAAFVEGERLRPIGHERLASASASGPGRPDNAPAALGIKALVAAGLAGAPNEETENPVALDVFDQRVAARLAKAAKSTGLSGSSAKTSSAPPAGSARNAFLARRIGSGQWSPRRSSVTSAKRRPSSNEGEDGARRRRRVGRVAEIGEPIFGERLSRARGRGRARVADQRADAGQAAAVEKRGRRAPPAPPRRTDRRPARDRRRAAGPSSGSPQSAATATALASALSAIAWIASGSTSIAVASRAPAFIAAIATSPPPAPRSRTRFAATVSGWSIR